MPNAESDDLTLPSGADSGSPPGDRRFRPDVEGLRAVAIVLVVLFHVGIGQFRSGYVGVDVFFVISGFVITGLLLREVSSKGRVGLLSFYARRARRILPAALLVIMATLVASELLVGRQSAHLAAVDGRWSALFLGNFHFEWQHPNIFVTGPDSPLTNLWSLAVEEQFYLVYPLLFIGMAYVLSIGTPRIRLLVGLGFLTLLSFTYSVATTQPGQFAAYYSPIARFWELSVGCLIAVLAHYLKRLPPAVACSMTWMGCIGIALSAFVIPPNLPYPGSIAALPVGSTALVIAGGTVATKWGAEVLLGTWPFRWVGRWSYGWYLWHWPVLVIAAEAAHTTVFASPLPKNLTLLGLSLVLACATYFFVETPIRRSRRFAASPGATLLWAVVLVASCVALTFAF